MWPKREFAWIEGRTLYVSIPFTWNLPRVRGNLMQKSIFWDRAIVGGPAVKLMPNAFDGLENVTIGGGLPGVLQRINPQATRTTTGCVRSCGFCAVPMIEGRFKHLDEWPDLPIICDNNLLASEDKHFQRVMERLIRHGFADFNQGLDSRLLSDFHVDLMARIKKPMIRLALDSMDYADDWEEAFRLLVNGGIAKQNIRSYALIGWKDEPSKAWYRCGWIERHKIKVLPMWYHPLDSLCENVVSKEQAELGWNDGKRRHIMGYFYKHRGAPPLQHQPDAPPNE